jgi:Flp pilus assembly protein TadG
VSIGALGRCRRGAAALEFALVAPLFITLIGGTVELARWGWGAAALRDAAARGARCIRVDTGRCGSSEAVRAELADAAPVEAVSFEASACGVRVTASGGFPASLTPGLGRSSAHACAP